MMASGLGSSSQHITLMPSECIEIKMKMLNNITHHKSVSILHVDIVDFTEIFKESFNVFLPDIVVELADVNPIP